MALTFSELIERILILTYLFKKSGKNEYLSVKSILETLNYTYSYSDIYQIAKYLQTDGQESILPSLGDSFIQITTQGTITVEKKLFSSAYFKEFTVVSIMEIFLVKLNLIPVNPF
jgi:hypothetical protein